MNSMHYLLKLQYLGHRFDGVQKNPGIRSLQGLLEERIVTAFGLTEGCSTKFSSRTDKMVSALENYCLLMTGDVQLPGSAMVRLNAFLPPDIRVLEFKKVDSSFVLQKAVVEKEYTYTFSCARQVHPFVSPFVVNFEDELDLQVMKEAAELFVGEHYFMNYCLRPKAASEFTRTIFSCSLERAEGHKYPYYPEDVYQVSIRGDRFLRGQVRLMVGTLIRAGKKEITLTQIEASLKQADPSFVKFLVPAAGLTLTKSRLLPDL